MPKQLVTFSIAKTIRQGLKKNVYIENGAKKLLPANPAITILNRGFLERTTPKQWFRCDV